MACRSLQILREIRPPISYINGHHFENYPIIEEAPLLHAKKLYDVSSMLSCVLDLSRVQIEARQADSVGSGSR